MHWYEYCPVGPEEHFGQLYYKHAATYRTTNGKYCAPLGTHQVLNTICINDQTLSQHSVPTVIIAKKWNVHASKFRKKMFLNTSLNLQLFNREEQFLVPV
jgi:hypothetical protein